MYFNMTDLLQTQNLDHITEPFTKEQIDAVVANMPPDKAPEPDGFNGKFIKKCWGIIKEDIYKLCLDFFDGAVDLQTINNSFITLVPKVNNPTTVNDFRPISLINCVVKIITKLLGDRPQKVIVSLVHQNQYGFIKTRIIQDCLAWVFEYIYQCQQSKQEIVIIKLDFTKAFDTIEHSIIIQMMKGFGFNEPWLQWTENILSTATTSVLLNGVPGKQLACKRGVRQGDPMSPMLFVMAAELLQCIINKTLHMGLIQMPIPSRGTTDFPIIQYADDTILIMHALQRELLCLKGNFGDVCTIYWAASQLC
jgi:hypothetical protein